MKKLFALLIAAGCLISYNAMAEDIYDNKPIEIIGVIVDNSEYEKKVDKIRLEKKLLLQEMQEIAEEEMNGEEAEAISEVEEVILSTEEDTPVVQEEVEDTATEMEEKVTLPTEVTE